MGRLTGVLSNTSMGTVCSATARGGTVTLSMANVKLVSVHSLAFGIGNSVGEEILHNGGGLDGPPSLISGGLVLLGHGLTADTSSVFGEGDDVLVCEHIFHEFVGLGGVQSLDVVGDFSAVLEVHAEVGAAALGVGHGGIGFDGVAHHG